MLHLKRGNQKGWGVVIIVFSLPSVVTGGGFIVGFMMGVIGGVKALRLKPCLQAAMPSQ
jgi:hypothetical protein